MLTRRKALLGLLFAPAIIKTPGLLMSIKVKPKFHLPILSMQLGWEWNESAGLDELNRKLIHDFAKAVEMPVHLLQPPMLTTQLEVQQAESYFINVQDTLKVSWDLYKYEYKT